MTVMEQKLNSNLVHETNKFQMINPNNQTDQNHHTQMTSSNEKANSYSRKNSTTGSNGIPTSNLSLSSTSSAGSSSKYTDSKFKKFSNNSFKNYDSTPPHTSRRASGNSITIRITNETNDNVEDESLNKVLNEIDSFDKPDLEELDDRGYGDRDRDEAEDTTSESTSNEHITSSLARHQNSKKKLKDRRKLVRSSAQQQHHLLYQESEDQIEEELKSKYNSLEDQLNEEYPNKSMNSAFDELFAAAETGNTSISAIVEAKMAAVTHAHEQVDYEGDSSFLRSKNSFVSRSRNGSFRASNKKGLSIDESKFVNNAYVNNNYSNNSSNNESTSTINKTSSNKKSSNNALNVDDNLGAPQLLTRSCSCKRPGSFKKMKAKNSGITSGGGISPNRANQTSPYNTSKANSNSTKINTSGPLMNGSNPNNIVSTSRRGTQCSIVLPDSLEKNSKLAGSLPFESNQLNDEDSEVCRVRQFNITQKGSVINRGDSFKRSFKRSNNSLSSTKKELSPIYYEGNTLNLPEFSDGFNKSSASSNCGLNETTTNNDCTSNSNESYGNNMHLSELNTSNVKESQEVVKEVEPVKSFLVYVIGTTGVGKNALIKQFKTSEYRGTYDLDNQEEDPSEGVNVMLDGVESVLQFMSMDFDMMKAGVISISELTRDNDAFIVVYSITDKSSYLVASDLLKSIRMNDNQRPVILVGNKSDLVRKRSVNRDDARNIALKYGCKFVETSVAINDKVDDLLAGILKQIRLKESSSKASTTHKEDETSFIETTNHMNNSTNLINSIRQQSMKRHARNYSDANIDMIRKTTKANTNLNPTMSFRTNTLTRRLFRSKNKENIENENTKYKRNQSLGGSGNSFFLKIFNNIFRKKSNMSLLNSVENLYTPPVFPNKTKK